MNAADHYLTRYLEAKDLDQYNALLRYTFQVTEEELTATGWKDDEIKQSKFPVLERADVLGNKLYAIDSNRPMRQSHNNPDVQELYKDFLEKPLSEKAEQLLHSDHVKEHNYM